MPYRAQHTLDDDRPSRVEAILRLASGEGRGVSCLKRGKVGIRFVSRFPPTPSPRLKQETALQVV
jgi:hypothetical protein